MQKQKWYKKMLTIILIVVNVTLYPKDIIISYAKENIGDVCEIQDESDINLHDVYATNTTISSEQIKNYFLSKVGQSVSQASCLAFIADGFQQLGATRSSANCAYEYGSSHICSTSMDNIPVGADVFFLWNQDYYKGTWYTCGNHYCHHIGVYVGDGYVVHTSGGKVVKTALSSLVTKGGTGWNMDFRGWGYHGNVTIGGDPTTPTNIFSSLSTSDISETNAQINAELTNISYVTTGGFYISKNADMSGSSKITENLNTNVKSMWYGMNKWYGTLSSGTTYYWQMYAVIGGTEYKSSVQSFTTVSSAYSEPTISDVKVERVTSEGFVVSCKVTDAYGVDRVQFPTWTEYNGQDDLIVDWGTNPNVSGVKNGDTFTFEVKRSDHNKERGEYNVHIYAYSTTGGYACFGLKVVIPEHNYDLDVNPIIDGQVYGIGLAGFLFNVNVWDTFGNDVSDIYGTRNAIDFYGRIPQGFSYEVETIYHEGYVNFGCSGVISEGENGVNEATPVWKTIYYNLFVNPNGGAFSNGNISCVIASPQLVYHGWNWCNISGYTPTRAGYALTGYFTAPSGGTKVYNADGSACFEGFFWSENGYNYLGDLGVYAQWEFVADVTPPVISNVTVSNLSGAGYTLTATVQDDIGISYVTFPTRRLNTGDNEWKWKKGTLNADGTYSVYIDMADYEYIDYTYETQVYAYDTSGNMSSVYPISQYVDTTPPIISDVYVTDITADGYTVHCTVNDNNSIDNIQCVKFPTWTLYNGQDDINPTWWHVDSLAMAGTRNGNEYTYRVNISDHNNEEGTYITHIYAFDKFGNRSIAKEAEVIIDNTNPVISNVKVFNISPDGYSVICTAEDNIGIAKVQFPTWTNNNGQDDLLEEWWLNPLYEGKKLGNSYRYDVSIEDHNFESGTYITHIYAYDLCNNYVQYRIPQIEVPENVGFRISVIPEQTYTGQPIKPSFRVYDDSKIMVEGVDYTVSYRNNTNVAKLSDAKAPTVVVTGKGNYSGKISQQFTINPRSVADANVQVSLKDLLATGKVQKPVPTISYSGKKLTARKDFEIYYPDEETEGAYQNPGTWRVLIKGINNFSGEREVKFTIAESIALSKAKVGAVPNQTYTGQPIKPELKITIGTDELIEGTDYTLEYQNNILPGKATITIHGIGKYLGTKTINFTILGTSLAKAQVSGIANKVYNGTLQTQNMTVILGDKVLVEDVDYKVGYQKNLNVGTANIVITGMGGYTGTIKKSFKITPYDIQLDADRQITGIPGSDFIIEYTKGGCTPDINVFFRGFRMDTKKDITVTYSNNTKLGTAEDVKAPTITIKGKGNFTGSVVVPFNIVEKNIGTQDNPVKITVPDVVAVNKPGKYVSIPSLVDSNGKKLVAGTDYNKTIVYTLDDGTVLDKNSIVPAGREITVTITGKGCYSGTVKATYRVTKESVNSAKVTVKNKTYTGKNVTLSEDDISVVVNKRTLIYGVDYEIVEDSYKGNVAKGNATVSIKGKGNYGGMKTVKFTIAAKNIY